MKHSARTLGTRSQDPLRPTTTPTQQTPPLPPVRHHHHLSLGFDNKTTTIPPHFVPYTARSWSTSHRTPGSEVGDGGPFIFALVDRLTFTDELKDCNSLCPNNSIHLLAQKKILTS
ncbi:hypothetical protein E2C01_056547 [Portunus trituberculatus]|uniref:Uncharacterized protein n=1 Tax=Portunus trituberculatus TaxID=210409 RepID=A0A5B7GUF5_PORTR|nr:hypothetical protein [Portunus trituberculatus]